MDTCNICFDTHENLITLSCKCNVKYCLTCISTWFNECKDTFCPICKIQTHQSHNTDFNKGFAIQKISNGYNFINYNLQIYDIEISNLLKFSNTIYYAEILHDNEDTILFILTEFFHKIKTDIHKYPGLSNCILTNIHYYKILTRTQHEIPTDIKQLSIRLLNIEFYTHTHKIIPHFEYIYEN